MKFEKLQTEVLYKTGKGVLLNEDSLESLRRQKRESIQLIITSPPFALVRQKEYKNELQKDYVVWFMKYAREVKRVLKDDGSFVIDLGPAYQKGLPVRSLYNYELLLTLCKELDFYLAEEFFWNNPSKLPSPIEWVNKRKIRVKDSVNTIWWLSKTPFPKTNMKDVLKPYSDKMLRLLSNPEKYYKVKERPSGHSISKGFGTNNGGAIPSNLLNISNAESNSRYLALCKQGDLKAHPARYPSKLPEFFIKFLTDKNDIVMDIFAGSNTTGEVAETLGRKWISAEMNIDYALISSLRFFDTKKLILNSTFKRHPILSKIKLLK